MRWKTAWACACVAQGFLLSTAGAISSPAPGAATAQTLKLPDGPGSLKGLASDPSVNVFSGQISYEVPIELPGARRGFSPSLALGYRGDLGNGPLGVGWSVRQVAIRRSTRLGVPRFDASDELVLVGIGDAGRLVAAGDGTYRVEGRGNDVKIVPEAGGYRVVDADGTQYRLGEADATRQHDGARVVAWLAQDVVDLTGQRIVFGYAQDRGQIYLTDVTWGPGDVFHAAFELADRPDVTISYREGFPVTTGKRIAAVRVESFGEVLRRYALSYDQRFALSRLVGVRMSGRGGADSLPPLAFHYADVSQPQLAALPGIETWRLNAHGVSLVDVDGDGAQDLLRVEAGQHAYKRNLGGSFGASIAITGADATSLDQARLMDVEGKARPNLVAVVNDTWRPYRLDGTTWTSVGAWAGTTGVPVLGDAIVLADITGDGRVDAIQWSALSLSVRFGVGGTAGQGLAAPVSRPLIGGELVPGPGVFWNDVNGDGLVDVIQLGPTGLRLYLGLGDGTFLPRQSVAYPPGTDTLPQDRFRFADLDRDGLLDLVVVSPTAVRYYPGQPTAARFAATPIVLPGPEDAADDVVVSIADANGNGSDDVVWSSPRGMWLLDIAGPTTAGMLTSVDNGMGKSLAIDYDASATLARRAADAGQPWARLLQISIPVVVRTTMVLGGDAPARVTELAVRDGLFDAAENAFAGFLTGVRTVRGGGASRELATETTYHSGAGVNRVLRGRPVIVTRRAGDGRLIDVATNRWRAALIAGLPASDPLARKPALAEAWVDHDEGTGSPIRTHQLYDIDDQGRTIKETDDGRLDVLGDERIVERSYGSDAATWVRDRLCDERVTGAGGALVSDTRTYYGDATATLPLCAIGAGMVKRVDGWLADAGGRWVTLEQTEYDARGNTVSHRAGGVTRALGYDADGLHVVRESVSPEPGRELAWTAAWDSVQGLPRSISDPTGATTHLAYDPLGRLASVALGAAPPHLYYQYDWERPRPRTVTYQYDGAADQLPATLPPWTAGAGWRETVQILNGHGELVTAATRLAADRWIVDDARVRDAHGGVVFRAAPFTATGGEPPEAPPAGTAGTTLGYDALDRTVSELLPTGALRATSYGVFSVVVASSDLATVSSRLDGHGRVIHTERTVAGQLEASDTSYDAAGHVTAIVTGGVASTFGYDTLGRFITSADPDAGQRALAYDDAGQLIDYTNAAGQHVGFSYDGVARLIEQRGSAANLIRYHYDVPRPAGPSTFVAGRLAWAEDPEGTVELAYDAAGREVVTRRVIRGVAAQETRDYSPSGLPLHVTSDDGVAYQYGYDPAGRAIAIPGIWQANTLDAAGRPLDERFGNGAVQLTDRDVLGLPTRVRVLGATGTLYDVTATRTSFGALATASDGDGAGLRHDAAFTYDPAGRLVHATIGAAPGAYQFDYTYDALQNMRSRAASGPATLGGLFGTYRYGEAGAGPRQLTSIAGPVPTSFGYDAAGRQVTETGQVGKAFVYDALDHLLSVTTPGGATVHAYGWDGQRALTQEPDGSLWRWFSPSVVERGGARDHYISVGGRTIARIRAVPPAASAAAAATASAGASGAIVGRVILPLAVAIVVAVMLALMLAAARGRRRLAAAYATATVLAGQLGSCTSPHDATTRAAVSASSALYFHDGISAGATLFTGGAGQLVEERRFEPFGDDLDAFRPGAGAGAVDYAVEPTNLLGKPTDPATRLSYHGARWYAPDTARWLTPDPPTHGPDPKFAVAPWDLHPYMYVRQNPVSYWDPDGREPESRSYGWATAYVHALDPSRGSTPVRVLRGVALTVTAPIVVPILAIGQHAYYEVDEIVVHPVVTVAKGVWNAIKPEPLDPTIMKRMAGPVPMVTVPQIHAEEEADEPVYAYSHEDPAPVRAPAPVHHAHHRSHPHPAPTQPALPDLTPGTRPTGPFYIQTDHGGVSASERLQSTRAPCGVGCTMM